MRIMVLVAALAWALGLVSSALAAPAKPTVV